VVNLRPNRVDRARTKPKKPRVDAPGFRLAITKFAEIDAVARRIQDGLGPVGIVVSNAGIAKGNVPAEDTSDEHRRLHTEVDVDRLPWCCCAFGRQVPGQGKGSVVTVGSMSGFIVNKPRPQALGKASKAAVHHLTRSPAAERSESVRRPH
jgi:NAD(P)-dependent dehydrogenase (short-subunit alcohol dehydrogenase family)